MAKKTLRKGKIPVIKKDLEGGTIAEANNDGTIFLDKKVKADSPLAKEAVAHEKVHMNQMSRGDLNYDDNSVYWKGKKYPRSSMNEGSKKLPWEQEAYNKTKTMKKTPLKIYGVNKELIAGNKQTMNTFEDSGAAKVAMAGKALAGGIQANKAQQDAGKNKSDALTNKEELPDTSGAKKNPKNKNKTPLKQEAAKKEKFKGRQPKRTKVRSSKTLKRKEVRARGKTIGAIEATKASPITKKAGKKSWWTAGAENIKKEADAKKPTKLKATLIKKSVKIKQDSGPRIHPTTAKLKTEDAKRQNLKDTKIKDLKSQAYEHTIGRLDTKEERGRAVTKVKTTVKDAFKKSLVGRASKSLSQAYADYKAGKESRKKKGTPLAYKMKGVKPSWMGQTSVDGKGDTRKSTKAPKKPIISPLKEEGETAAEVAKREFRAKNEGIIGDATETITSKGKAGGDLPSYKEAWDVDLEGVTKKYKTYRDYVNDMEGIEEGDARDVERETARDKAKKGTLEESTETTFDPDEVEKRGDYNMGYDEAIDSRWAEGVRHRDRKQDMRQYERFEKQYNKFAKRGKVPTNPSTGEPFASAAEFAKYKGDWKTEDQQHNTMVGKRGPSSTGNVEVTSATEGYEDVSGKVGKTNSATDTENKVDGEGDAAAELNKKNKLKAPFKMKGWSSHN